MCVFVELTGLGHASLPKRAELLVGNSRNYRQVTSKSSLVGLTYLSDVS